MDQNKSVDIKLAVATYINQRLKRSPILTWFSV